MTISRVDLGPILAGMAVAGAAAVVASGVTLATLAGTAGWDGWTKWLLPAAVDVGGAAAGWAWLRPAFPATARQFGMVVTLSCAVASLAGNAVGHLIEADLLKSSAWLVIIVGAIPAAVLVALAHLAALLTDRSVTVKADAIAVTDQSTDSRSTTDTAGTGGPETPPAPAAQDPDPIESTPRPPVESSVGSGAKPKTPAAKKASAKAATPPPADGVWPPAEAVHVAEWDQTRQVAWLARHKAVGRTVAELHAATAIPARTIERRLQKAANQAATPPQEDPATDGASDLQEVTS